MTTDIQGLLGAEGDALLSHVCKGIPEESVHLPGDSRLSKSFLSMSPSTAVWPSSSLFTFRRIMKATSRNYCSRTHGFQFSR